MDAPDAPSSGAQLMSCVAAVIAIVVTIFVIHGMVSGIDQQRVSVVADLATIKTQIALGAVTVFVLGFGAYPLVRLYRGEHGSRRLTTTWAVCSVGLVIAWQIARLLVDES
jgi:hypothetical protein